MRRARAHLLVHAASTLALLLAAARNAAAEADPCDRHASLSPCFDADPLWLPTRPTPFLGVRSARAVAAHGLALVLGSDMSHRPVVLVTESPHPEGQEIDVVRTTSTLLLGARYGIGRGIDAGVALPFVPYQAGAGVESVTHQESDGLASLAIRDPRVELGATLLGGEPNSLLALGTHLELGLPFGTASALAGAAGPTVAPGFTAELGLDPLTLAFDLGLRLRQAVALGSVREGSSLTLALGASVTLLTEPLLALGVEASLSPTLASRPASAPSDTLDLPGEWLASARLAPNEAWTFMLGAGSGLPLSTARNPGSEPSGSLGVTSPDFRGVALARYTLPSLW